MREQPDRQIIDLNLIEIYSLRERITNSYFFFPLPLPGFPFEFP
jgi:hypothetical protein